MNRSGYDNDFAALGRLRGQDMKIVLATNNNTELPSGFAEKARRLGAPVSPDEVLTASVAAVQYLQRHFTPGSRVYVIAEQPFKQLLTEAGFVLADQDVIAVVASMDRAFTYDMLKRATLLIRGGALFVGANPDAFYPTPQGMLPGSGTIVAGLAASTGCEPVIMGKPERWLFDLALDRMGLAAGEVASLGDRLDTDIAGGRRAGLQTILVLSGVSRVEDIGSGPERPTWVFPSIVELAQALAEAKNGTEKPVF